MLTFRRRDKDRGADGWTVSYVARDCPDPKCEGEIRASKAGIQIRGIFPVFEDMNAFAKFYDAVDCALVHKTNFQHSPNPSPLKEDDVLEIIRRVHATRR